MQSMKETTSNIAASAKAGMEKTKAVVQEKVEKMSAHDPVQKEVATEKKEDRIARAELRKQEAREHNAAAKQGTATGGRPGYTTGGNYETQTHSATGGTGYPMGAHQMSATSAHEAGYTQGGIVEEGITRAHPSGLPGETTGHNIRVEENTLTGPGPNVPGYGLGERPKYGAGTRADEPGY